MGRVLVVDDERGIRDVLEVLLESRGHGVDVAESVSKARSALADQPYDLVITDLRLEPEGDGLEILQAARDRIDPPEVIVMTAYGSRERAQNAIAGGAAFYIEKGPHLASDVDVLSRQAIAKRQLEHELVDLRRALSGSHGRSGIIGKSEAIHEVLDLVDRVAPLRTTVLISGESGTGKEMVARALHDQAPWGADGSFVPLNCGAIPQNLIESELFGYVRGAFTGADGDKTGVFEAARGGTLFLDEIGELPIALQPNLLRVLQEHKVRRLGSAEEVTVADVRVVAASNRDLEAEVASGRFREDLYFRLNVVQIDLPPLRERTEDIVVLAEHFLRKYARAHGRRVSAIDPDALDCLTRFAFPGNVRQLENLIERGVALARGERLTVAELPRAIREVPSTPETPTSGDPAPDFPPTGVDLERMLDAFELDWIERALTAAGGVKTRAAELLGLSFRQFRYKLAKHKRPRARSKGVEGS